MLPACSYVREAPFIRFIRNKAEWEEQRYEDEESEEEYTFVSLRGQEWVVE